jgi:ABC-type hemin transport system ATPase subunit
MNNLTSYHPGNCAQSLAYLQQCCPRTEGGGIRHLLLVDKAYQPTLVAALDAAGDNRHTQLAAWLQARLAGKLVVVVHHDLVEAPHLFDEVLLLRGSIIGDTGSTKGFHL